MGKEKILVFTKAMRVKSNPGKDNREVEMTIHMRNSPENLL